MGDSASWAFLTVETVLFVWKQIYFKVWISIAIVVALVCKGKNITATHISLHASTNGVTDLFFNDKIMNLNNS